MVYALLSIFIMIAVILLVVGTARNRETINLINDRKLTFKRKLRAKNFTTEDKLKDKEINYLYESLLDAFPPGSTKSTGESHPDREMIDHLVQTTARDLGLKMSSQEARVMMKTYKDTLQELPEPAPSRR